jgi:hypothetical protein
MDDPSVGTWVRPDTLLVMNADTLPQSYAFASTGVFPGVSIASSPPALSLPPGGSADVVVTVTVNNAMVTNQPEDILRYTGFFSVIGNNDTARVPWAFARTNRLVVTTSEPGAYFLGFNTVAAFQSTDRVVNWTSPTRAEVYAPAKGTYEIFTLFRNPAGKSKIVFTEGFSFASDAAELSLNGAAAVYPLIYRGVDHAGNPLGAYRSPRRTLITSLPNFGDWATTLTGGSDTLLLSPVSATHSFRPVESELTMSYGGTFHVAQYDRFSGISGPVTLMNSPADYLQQHFRVKVPPGTTRAANIGVFYNYQLVGGIGQLSGLAAVIDTMTVSGDEYRFTGYFGKSSSATEDIAAIFYTSFTDFAHLSLDYESPVIMRYRDSLVATSREYVSPATPRFESGATMTLGGSPEHLLTLWYNNIVGSSTLHFRVVPRGMLNETRYSDLLSGTYTVVDPNGVALFTNSLVDPHLPMELPVSRYRVIIRGGASWLRHAKVHTTLTSEFHLGNDLNVIPPTLMSLSVLDGRGHPTDSLARGEPARLRFAFNESGFGGNVLPVFDSTKAWYRRHGTVSWIPLSVSKVADIVANEGTIVDALMGPATAVDSVAIDLRMATADVNGFTADYEVSPAFAVGSWDTTTVSGVPGEESPGIPAALVLAQNFPNPFNPSTIIRYGLPARIEVTLKVYNLLGQEVASLVNGNQASGFHEVRFNAAGLASGLYIFRLQAGSAVRSGKMLLLK